MVYYFEVCNILIKPKSKYKHFQSNTHKEFDKCKRIKPIFENPNRNNIDKFFLLKLSNIMKNLIITL